MAQPEYTNHCERTSDAPFAVGDFTRWATLAEQLCQEGVQQEIAADLAAGRAVFSCRLLVPSSRAVFSCRLLVPSSRAVFYGGTGAAAGKIFEHLPDGRRFEMRVHEDGSTEHIHQVAE